MNNLLQIENISRKTIFDKYLTPIIVKITIYAILEQEGMVSITLFSNYINLCIFGLETKK